MWLRCDLCRRYARLKLNGLHDVDYRMKTFSCSRCGSAAYLAVVEPIKETGMGDYRLDEVEAPRHHAKAVQRMMRNGERRSDVDMSAGELPGRSLKGRR
jgi:hypothetical protein